MPGENDDLGVEEAAFLARLSARDETAFNELVELYQGRVFALAYRLLGRRADAEEVAVDVFFQVFKSVDRFRGDSRLSTWLFRIATNLCKNRMKYDARRVHAGTDELGEALDRLPTESAEGVSMGSVERPDDLLSGVELDRLVKEAILELSPDCRELVILRDLQDLSYEEIAQVTGLPTGTVKSRIHRGRVELRDAVERRVRAKGLRREAVPKTPRVRSKR